MIILLYMHVRCLSYSAFVCANVHVVRQVCMCAFVACIINFLTACLLNRFVFFTLKIEPVKRINFVQLHCSSMGVVISGTTYNIKYETFSGE